MEHVHPQDDPLTAPSPTPAGATATTYGERVRSRGHIRSFPGGRTCGASECQTVLSRYNDAVVCWLHTSDGAPRRP